MPDEVMMASAMESSDARSICAPAGSDESLRQSRIMLASILHSVPQAIFWKDCNGAYLGCNDIFARWVGIDSPNQIVGKTDFDLPWPREQAEVYRAADRDVIEYKKPNHHICEPLRRADGVNIWIDTSKVPLIDEAGCVHGVLGMCEDITARKQAEERFVKAFRLGPSVLAIIRVKDSCILDINDSFEKYTGYHRDEVVGHTAIELRLWDDLRKREQLYQKLFAEGSVRNEECRFRIKNGDVLTGLTSVDVIEIDGETCGLVVIADITERRRAEEALEKRILALTKPLGDVDDLAFEDLFNVQDIQRLQDEFSAATGVASIITRADGSPITTPSNFCRLCNDIIRKTEKGCANCYRSDAALGEFHPEGPIVRPCMSGGLWDAGAGITVGGKHIANWLIGQVRDETQTEAKMAEYAREIGADERTVIEAFREVPSMSQKQFDQVAKALFTLANQLSTSAYQNVQQARFIADRKRAEQALERSERKYRELYASLRDGLTVATMDGTVKECNAAFQAMVGYTAEELARLTYEDLTPEKWHQQEARIIQEQVMTRGYSDIYEKEYRRKDGSVFPVELQTYLLRDENGAPAGLWAFIRDITERKRAAKVQKLNAERSAVLLKLNQMVGATLDEITTFALEMSIRMCESTIGYLAFLNDDESVLTMQAWSRSAMAECEIADKPIDYPVVTTGLWGEAVRQRKAVITNDYDEPNPFKKGYPEGHVRIRRHMNIPVLVGSKIVLVAGVGNKEEPYDETDVQQLTLLMEGMWRLVEHHRAEEELNRYRGHLEELVEDRTKELEASRKEALSLMRDANAQQQRAEAALEALRESEEQLRKSELELRVSNEHLARAQAVAHVGHWTWDVTTGHITGSDEYHRIRGSTPDTVKEYEDGLKTIHPDDLEQWKRIAEAARAGEKPYIVDYRIVMPDKSVKYVHAQGQTTFDENGKPKVIFGALFDVTDTKIAEMKLKEAMIAAETANRAKSLFLANMSHELRTPLTAVLGFSQLLRDDPSLTDTQKENLDIINRSGAHLLELINDVLDMSKIEAGQLGLQETVFSLSSVLETVEEMMRVRADAKGLSFQLDRDPTLPRYIKTDEKKLKQVLINLAGNAVKFTRKGGVVVRVRMEDEGNTLKCEVEDTGPGIHAEDIPSLFDRFVQVGEDQEGVGLGLYISRKLVDLMGGRITVESEPERGTRFSFTIHCTPGSIGETRPLTEHRKVVGQVPGQVPRHILVVEDKLETRLLVVKMLQAVGFHVLEAENGHEAVKRFETHRPDLILMDMRMPIMDGYRATRKIKSMERGKSTPIIALTASAFDEERQKTLAAGADDYMGKPIKIDELYEKIRVHLGIDYTYADVQPTAPTACDRTVLGEMVASLPLDVANRLTEAISALDLDGLMTLLPEVSSHAPVLAEHLTKLAKGYEIAKLAELLETRSVP